jgi:hypothetical protein
MPSQKCPTGLFDLSSRPVKHAKSHALDADELGDVLAPVLAIVIFWVFADARTTLCNVTRELVSNLMRKRVFRGCLKQLLRASDCRGRAIWQVRRDHALYEWYTRPHLPLEDAFFDTKLLA